MAVRRSVSAVRASWRLTGSRSRGQAKPLGACRRTRRVGLGEPRQDGHSNWWTGPPGALDPTVGLAIAGLAVREAREAWKRNACADCAPFGFSDDPCR